MTSQKMLASLAGAMLLVSPAIAFASTPSKPATTTPAKDACKNLKGSAFKACQAKQHNAIKAAKTAK
ncbi:hypothetical protein [Croceibacterium aestuarii]|uniref:hypothetical protein n=1 Tax=Croceibacterium aestuarii TaxID=3064139 RepID=UPI00272E51C4|nr:hypothetical protein [Croceibacterium sp. D39]